MIKKASNIINITDNIVTIFDNLFSENIDEETFNKWLERYKLISQIETDFYNNLTKDELIKLYNLIDSSSVDDDDFEKVKKYMGVQERICKKIKERIITKDILNEDERTITSIFPNIPTPKILELLEALECDINLILLESYNKDNPQLKSRLSLQNPPLERYLIRNKGKFIPSHYISSKFVADSLGISDKDYNNIKNYYYIANVDNVLENIASLKKFPIDIQDINATLMRLYLETIKACYILLDTKDHHTRNADMEILNINCSLYNEFSLNTKTKIKKAIDNGVEDRKKYSSVSIIR